MGDLDGRLFRRKGNALLPADRHAEDFLGELTDAKDVLVTIRQPRNPDHHRFFFAKLKAIVDATGRWGDVEELLDDLKLATRHVEKRQNIITGVWYMKPKSIAFAAMGQAAFRRFDDRCNYVLAEAGIDVDEIVKQASEAAKRAPSPAA